MIKQPKNLQFHLENGHRIGHTIAPNHQPQDMTRPVSHAEYLERLQKLLKRLFTTEAWEHIHTSPHAIFFARTWVETTKPSIGCGFVLQTLCIACCVLLVPAAFYYQPSSLTFKRIVNGFWGLLSVSPEN